MQTDKVIQVAIIGRGPAGIATAIQLNKYCSGLLVLFSKQWHSGLLPYAYNIENYPGFPHGITGAKLWSKFYAQLLQNNVQQVFHDVDLLNFDERIKLFTIKVGDEVYYAKYVVVATGTISKQLELPKLDPTVINTCIHYDLTKIIQQHSKKIAIIGAGDAAFDYALSLSQNNLVTIFNRGSSINASIALQKQIKTNQKIFYYDNAQLISLKPCGMMRQQLFFQQAPNVVSYVFDYVVAAIGRVPNKAFYSARLAELETTLIENKLLYLVGYIKNNMCRQVAISVADGIIAAMQLKNLVA